MIIQQLESIKERFEEVSQQITMPEVVSDMDKFKKISKEYRDLEKIVVEFDKYPRCVQTNACWLCSKRN